MSFKIISQPVGSPGASERVEIDNIDNKIDACFFLECRKDMEAGKPGVTIKSEAPEMAFTALSEDGKTGVSYKVKEK